MRFKSPGGNLVWLTPLLFLAGIFLAYNYTLEGKVGFAILYGSLGLLSSLVWFDIKWVAVPLMVYFSLVFFVILVMLLVKGFSWNLTVRLLFVGFTIHDFWEWRNKYTDFPCTTR